ncbi:MAG: L-dopachrome tautomerase-related protein [Nocardioides sp.]|uniref:L-dopachrome tautomerase-related protein n=1 Tax=Nocardioides sp. TaxID=35761 RepID=UPI0039E61A93
MPRYPGHEKTPSVGRRQSDGTVAPFPGDAWNEWRRGDSGRDAFVYVNGMHVFSDDTVWCVDQGALRADSAPPRLATPKPGAQKLVQLDPASGEVLEVIRFDDDILPAQAKMNDLRIHGSTAYITDSGIGAIIVHDLNTGTTLRRLSGAAEMQAEDSADGSASASASTGAHKTPKSDMIEVSNDGKWLYWAAPTGPLRRIRTSLITDRSLTDSDLVPHIEKVADIPKSGGCSIDTLGNFYFSDLEHKQIVVRAPDGRTAVLAGDPELVSPDGSFISADRHLYVPATQSERTKLFGNPRDMTVKPFRIYTCELPTEYAGIRLGDAVTGSVTPS